MTSISRTVLAPRDAPEALGLAEPSFRVRAKLEEEFVQAYGEAMPLQAGMTLRADLILEDRTLWQVLTNPLRASLR